MTDHILFKTEVQRCSKISKTNVIYHFFSKSNTYSSSFKVYIIINHISYHYITKTKRTSYARYNSRCTWRLDQCYHWKVLCCTLDLDQMAQKTSTSRQRAFRAALFATQREDIQSYCLNHIESIAFILIPVLWKDLTQLYQGNRLQQTTGFEYRFTMIYSMFCSKLTPLLNNLYGYEEPSEELAIEEGSFTEGSNLLGQGSHDALVVHLFLQFDVRKM